MKYYMAPMEGLTSYVFRNAYHRIFTPFDRYYMPFVSPTQDKHFTARQWRDINPENNRDLPVVPQLLTNRSDLFLWAAGELAAAGYTEVNLNLGCPSGTVVSKRKGSGFLADPAALDVFFDEIFSRSPVRISVKTRLGMKDPSEFLRILEIYNQYPICELIIHPRVQADLYRRPCHMASFLWGFEHSTAPVCYNGNLFCREDYEELLEQVDTLSCVMLGRGMAANPGLLEQLKGGTGADPVRLQEFHDEIFRNYCETMPGEKPTIYKMRELWNYLGQMFIGAERSLKRIRKAEHLEEYEQAVAALWREAQLNPHGRYYA